MSGEITSGVQDVTFLPVVDDDHKFDLKSPTLGCDVCNIKVTSQTILQRHLEGRKHKLRAERKDKEYICELCELKANSQTQLNIHLNSSKHKARLVRKEYNEFTDVVHSSRALWVLFFCACCILLNMLIIFFQSFN